MKLDPFEQITTNAHYKAIRQWTSNAALGTI